MLRKLLVCCCLKEMVLRGIFEMKLLEEVVVLKIVGLVVLLSGILDLNLLDVLEVVGLLMIS